MRRTRSTRLPRTAGSWSATPVGSASGCRRSPSRARDADQRLCTTQTGDRIVERIVERSDQGRHYTCEIIESPMPLRSYRSQLAVHGHDDHAHLIWVAEFEPEGAEVEEELRSLLLDTYRRGLESLRDAVERG